MLSKTYRYVLARWVWVDNGIEQYWQPPAGAVATVDLRPTPAQVLKGTQPAEGFGLFALDQAAPVPVGALNLGMDLNAIPAEDTIRGAEERLELAVGDLNTATLLNNSWLVLTDLADVTGTDRVKPLMPNTAGHIEIRLAGHSIVKTERFDKVKHPFVRNMVMQEYARYKQETVPGRTAKDEGRVLSALKRKYGFKASEIAVPTGGASVSDAFNRTNSDLLGADWNEVDGDWDILSNELRFEGGATYPGSLRHTTELDSDDQYAQLDFVTADATSSLIGPAVRFAAAAETFYGAIIRESGSLRSIVKVVSGTQTILDSDVAGSGPPQLIRLDIDGSNYEMFDDGVSAFSGTDTSITGNLQVGVMGHSVSKGSADNFEAADLAAGPVSQIRHSSLSLDVGR